MLPEWYKKGIARVSDIVSFYSPFKGTEWERRYFDWLADRVPEPRKRWFTISPDEYTKEACDVWTFVHLQMEKRIKWETLDFENPLFLIHDKEIQWGLQHIDKLMEKYPDATWETEVVVRDKFNRFQGTIDLVRIDNGRVYLYDYKTWWIAKKKWKLPNNTLNPKWTAYKKDADKLKKVACQLSLYAETYRQKWYEIGWIYLIHLHEQWCFEVSLAAEDNPRQKVPHIRIWSTSDINDLLSSYKEAQERLERLAIKNASIIFNKDSKMIFEIRVPLESYAYVNVTIDMYKEKDWKTIDEKIDDARGAIKYYLENRSVWTEKKD